ncbi:hypothetical protein Q3G72_004210 [Acer saccharum]|nr:hypothetical protein Q3G72_004210 [Acer saccharum]
MREEENTYGTISKLAQVGTARAKRKANARWFWAAIDRDSPRSRSGSDPPVGVVWLHRRRALPSGDSVVVKAATNVWD